MLQQSSTVPLGPEGPRQFIRLWTHEVLRVFYDRLVDDEDRNWLLGFVGQLIKTHFRQDFEKLFSHLLSDSSGIIGQTEMRRYMFLSNLVMHFVASYNIRKLSKQKFSLFRLNFYGIPLMI
mgnify:FL=1